MTCVRRVCLLINRSDISRFPERRTCIAVEFLKVLYNGVHSNLFVEGRTVTWLQYRSLPIVNTLLNS